MSDKMSIDKKDPSKDDSDDSGTSSPENDSAQAAPQESQPAKRKGGRKPIYATSEERKQRNRQAQAAFRERRTEYIKQLEETIRVHESNLNNLQAAHRSAADECLMLRYKNSLLERILLEKGIDVQAELHAKTGSPNLGPSHMPQNMVQPPPIQRAMFNRHHGARRSASSIAPKTDSGVGNAVANNSNLAQSMASPKSRPTPPSHVASPTTSTPGFSGSAASPIAAGPHGLRSTLPAPLPARVPQMAPMPGMSAAGRQQLLAQQQKQHQQQALQQPPQTPLQQQQPQQPPPQGLHQQQGPQLGQVPLPPPARPPGIYPSQSFQSHIEQLEQEYDAPNDMIDDVESETPGPSPYSAGYTTSQAPSIPMQTGHNIAPAAAQAQVQAHTQTQMGHGDQGAQTQGQGYPSMTQLLDPALDWDPFGLSASMAFPSQFSFDTSNMR
ncbi:AP-1-like transcription factor [Microdochium nivale]|nr:AP-1-like transcription factor [Microdochium nivale]